MSVRIKFQNFDRILSEICMNSKFSKYSLNVVEKLGESQLNSGKILNKFGVNLKLDTSWASGYFFNL